ncbi:MAG: acetoin utilization protein AcuC, partial [bacterium]|nr:acetoin utilization protein AcuC [bacterium]
MGVYAGEALAGYGFGEEHPFGPDRFRVFWTRFQKLDLEEQTRVLEPVAGDEEDALAFHSNAYVDLLKARSASGEGFLDSGDTPAFPGILEAALTVVGSVLDGIERILKGEIRRAFVPIAGLHHARRDRAAGFCAL